MMSFEPTKHEWVNAREDEDGTWSLIEVATGEVLKTGLNAVKIVDHMKMVNNLPPEQFDKWKHLRKTFKPLNLT